MTLADIINQPMDIEAARGLALVFDADLRDTLAAIQAEHGDPRHRAEPVTLPDGRWFLIADLLTEIGPGGLFAGGFSRLPAERFADVAVVPLSSLFPPAE